jgi:hypothetical protein
MELIELWWEIKEEKENGSQTTSNDIDVENPPPTEPCGDKLSCCFLLVYTDRIMEEDLPMTGPNEAKGALVKNIKDAMAGRYLFGTNSPSATENVSCTTSPRP